MPWIFSVFGQSAWGIFLLQARLGAGLGMKLLILLTEAEYEFWQLPCLV